MFIKNRLWILPLIIFAFIFMLSTEVWAGEKGPLTIDADWISYDSETGDFSARGNVLASQQDMSLQADNLEGNMNTKDTHAHGNVFWQRGVDNFKGDEFFYNYNTQAGFFQNLDGFVEGFYVQSNRGEQDAEKISLEKNWLTKCDAEEVKCYEITAKKIVIYPGEKLVAYDASFWILGKKVFTLKKYTASLKKQDPRDSGLPKVGYSSSKGVSVSYKYNLSLAEEDSNDISSFISFDYYSKLGIYPKYQADKETDKEHWKLVLGKEQDKDDLDLEMLPSLTWQKKTQQISHTSLFYTYGLGVGHFEQKSKNASAWRTTGNIGLYSEPIQLWDKASLNLWTTYQKNWYNNQDKMGVWSYGAGLNQGLGEKASLGVTYTHREISGRTPFNFDDPGAANELNASLNYQLDEKWKVGVSTVYNLDTNKYTDIDYTLTRNLHCFEARFVWREKRDEFNWNIDLINF